MCLVDCNCFCFRCAFGRYKVATLQPLTLTGFGNKANQVSAQGQSHQTASWISFDQSHQHRHFNDSESDDGNRRGRSSTRRPRHHSHRLPSEMISLPPVAVTRDGGHRSEVAADDKLLREHRRAPAVYRQQDRTRRRPSSETPPRRDSSDNSDFNSGDEIPPSYHEFHLNQPSSPTDLTGNWYPDIPPNAFEPSAPSLHSQGHPSSRPQSFDSPSYTLPFAPPYDTLSSHHEPYTRQPMPGNAVENRRHDPNTAASDDL